MVKVRPRASGGKNISGFNGVGVQTSERGWASPPLAAAAEHAGCACYPPGPLVAARKKQGSNAGLILVAMGLGAALWGAERWRGHAARRAGTSEKARATALARCVFGADAITVLRSPAAARTRLRLLAFATPADPAVTWLDRCVPIARSFALHAGEVDDTRAVTATPSHLRERSRVLVREMDSLGLVWRARAGDPEVDMSRLVDAFIRVLAELDVSADGAAGDIDTLDAPTPVALPSSTLVPSQGLEPTAIGSPSHFFAGAPLPGLVSVALEDSRWAVHTLATISSHVSVLRPGGLLRVDARTGATEDGLTDLRWIRPQTATEGVRVAPVDESIDGVHMDVDGFASGSDVFWLAQWSPALGTVFARHSPRRGWASFTLANSTPDALERSRHPVRGRTRSFDEHVAIAPLATGAVAAYTTRGESGERSTISFAAAVRDSDQPQIVRLGDTRVAGRTPELHFCPRSNGSPWLFVAASSEWLVLETDGTRVTEKLRHTSPFRGAFAEHAAVRCEGERVVMYPLERGRSTPSIVCEGERCRAVNPPTIQQPLTMPAYTTRTPDGRALVHSDWPTVTALSGSTLVFARAAGSVVAVSLRGPSDSRWDRERVVFDASAAQHGVTVEGLGLYADGAVLTLAVSVPEGLRILRSDDRGASWR